MRIGTDHIGLVNLINSLNKSNLILVEVGVYKGNGTDTILSTGKIKTIYCIDPWAIINEKTNDKCTFDNYDAIEKSFDQFASNYPEIIKHKGTLDTFIKEFKDKLSTIDFVYIDANHTYESVCHDIDITQNIIKPKLGYGGHDFADFPEYIQGVKKAVLKKVGTPDNVFEDTSWIKYNR